MEGAGLVLRADGHGAPRAATRRLERVATALPARSSNIENADLVYTRRIAPLPRLVLTAR